jgi:hypothetical protein
MCGPGRTFGEAVVFLDKPYPVSAQAMTEADPADFQARAARCDGRQQHAQPQDAGQPVVTPA